MLLELTEITKSFDSQPVLRGVSFSVARGEIVALLGPSGCGKTTLLRIVAGLERPDGGRLELEGEDLVNVPVHQRGFGLVFQDYALFPHKDVADNVTFGLKMLGWSPGRAQERAKQVLELVGLAGFGERAVFDLSGGEQQRVALARSLAPSPRLLLLDEPLGSLDRALRERLMGELRSILKQAGSYTGQPQGITAIYVTHDQEEAFAVADRVLVMNAGQIEQKGTPAELYSGPRNAFVARFLGMDNLLPAKVRSCAPPVVDSAIGPLRVASVDTSIGTEVTLLIRPGAATITEDGEIGENVVIGRIDQISFRGRHQVITVAVPTEAGHVPLKLEMPSTVQLPPADRGLTLSLDPQKLSVLE
jgi:ABC-type Fe3+/spermidine/putrescine transport system ATPase subunit